MSLLLLVGADDRSGAAETAGACADAGLKSIVTVESFAPRADVDVVAEAEVEVVDLHTRHLSPPEAAEHVVALVDRLPDRYAHKIDSTLRGNWADEVVARQRVTGERVLVVAAAPAVGRVCRGGVVHEHGRPVTSGAASLDLRRPPASARPRELLAQAGAGPVDDLRSLAALDEWLMGTGPAAVVDAVTDEDLEAIARRWIEGGERGFMAGTGAAIGAVARAMIAPRPSTARPRLAWPALVVCGSRHPTAAAQLDALVAQGAKRIAPDMIDTVADTIPESHTVVLAPRPSATHLAATPDEVAHALGAAARRLIERSPMVATVMIVGGDTAAAVIGDRTLVVGGTLAPGVAWGHLARAAAPLVVVKPGGFGHPGTLVDLLRGRLPE